MTVIYREDFNHGTPGDAITVTNTPNLNSVVSNSSGGFVRFFSPSWDGSVGAQLHTQASSGSSIIRYVVGLTAAATGVATAKMRGNIGTGGTGSTSFSLTLWDAGNSSATRTQIQAGYGTDGGAQVLRITNPATSTWVTLAPDDGAAWVDVQFRWGASGVDWQVGTHSGSYPYVAGPPVTLDLSCTVNGTVGNDLYIDEVELSRPAGLPPRRIHPRGDGLAGSSAPRTAPGHQSEQASNRRVGGYL